MEVIRSLAFPEPAWADFQKLVERLGRAGWIQAALVTEDPLEIIWSEKGRAKMFALTQVLMQLAPGYFDLGAKRCGSLRGVKLQFEWMRLTRELCWPWLYGREDSALLYITSCIGTAHKGTAPIDKWFKTRLN